MSADTSHYVIRGGVEGRERLRLLARVMHSTSSQLFDRIGIVEAMTCLDVGCGGGDATLELGRRVGPRGRVVGADIDTTKLAMARTEAADRGATNVRFEELDVRTATLAAKFDVVYSRFLLTHLSDPGGAVAAFRRHLRPGGVVAVEDIDFSGYFTYPESAAFQRYHRYYCESVRRRGGDPNIGPRLPGLLRQSGLEDINVAIVQPVGMEGEVKLLTPITMQNIIGTVLADGMATQEELDEVVRELYEFAADPHTLVSVPRVVQAWGRLPG